MMDSIFSYLKQAIEEGASDVLVIAGSPILFRKDGITQTATSEILTPALSSSFINELYAQAGRDIKHFAASGDDDFSVSVPHVSRFRVTSYCQRGSMAATIRIVNFGIPDASKLHIPSEVLSLAAIQRGLVLVAGPTGGGLSTTMACIIDAINRTRRAYIVTIEDPIEYLHSNLQSTVSQRELAIDTVSYAAALHACLRQSPDVIFLSELRDIETIRMAIIAAGSGRLVLSTVRSIGAGNVLDYILDAFPPKQQTQARLRLAQILRAVTSQQLLPSIGGKLVPAFEIMRVTGELRGHIRSGDIQAIDALIRVSGSEGMRSMDDDIRSLWRAGSVTASTAVQYAMNPEEMQAELPSSCL